MRYNYDQRLRLFETSILLVDIARKYLCITTTSLVALDYSIFKKALDSAYAFIVHYDRIRMCCLLMLSTILT